MTFEDKTNNYFANRIKTLRENIGLTQIELAKQFNITSRTISQYERGLRTPDFSLLNQFANYFDVSVDYLLGRTNVKNTKNDSPYNELIYKIDSLSADNKKRLEHFVDFLLFEENNYK